MKTGRLELTDLGSLVSHERNRRGMSLREAAADTGVPFNTLARVEKGNVPDLPKFKRLVEWCGTDINQFFELQERSSTTTDLIAEHLRADRNLPAEAAEQIIEIVRSLYQALVQPQEICAIHLRTARTFRPEAARELGLLLKDLNKVLTEEKH